MWYRPYVSAHERRRQALREIQKRAKKGQAIEPVHIEGRAIAKTFWGKAWCEHLEGYSDYENRLPRGRTYVRNGSVLHLGVAPGRVSALVQGTETYEVSVTIAKLEPARWKRIVSACTGRIDSLVELLQGKLSRGVMEVVTDRDRGLFPAPRQIEMDCSCPDWATMCKHVAAVLYGVGARLDDQPDLLFALRGVDHLELVSASPSAPRAKSDRRELDTSELSSVFGIDLDLTAGRPAVQRRQPPAPRVTESRTRFRRTTGDLEILADRIVGVVAAHPKTGLRAEEIRRVLGVRPSELVRPIAALLLSRRLRKVGVKRATTYFAR
jgi:uncharacterized Zn finger protein